MDKVINEIFQYVFAALLTPINILVSLGIFIFLSAILALIFGWAFDVNEQTELLWKIERNTRKKEEE